MTISNVDELLTGLNKGRPTCLVISELPVKAKGMCHHNPETGMDIITLLPSILDEEREHLSEGIFHELGHLNLDHIVRSAEGVANGIPSWRMHELGPAGVARRAEIEREATTFGAMLAAALEATLASLGIGSLNSYLLSLITEKESTA
jgi:hypothetical protein